MLPAPVLLVGWRHARLACFSRHAPRYTQGGLEGEGLALARGNMAAPELARLLYWLLVVGYSLRTI